MSNNLPIEIIENFAITTLDKIAVGATCVIESCNLPDTLKLRLEEMGLTRGANVTVLKTAPLGDPLEIRVRGYSLCIRKETAQHFTVTPTKREVGFSPLQR